VVLLPGVSVARRLLAEFPRENIDRITDILSEEVPGEAGGPNGAVDLNIWELWRARIDNRHLADRITGFAASKEAEGSTARSWGVARDGSADGGYWGSSLLLWSFGRLWSCGPPGQRGGGAGIHVGWEVFQRSQISLVISSADAFNCKVCCNCFLQVCPEKWVYRKEDETVEKVYRDRDIAI
jgi:hypothetical protein